MELSKTLAHDPVRALVYGLPGTGKSTLVAELANHFNLKWIDTENSISILKKLDAKAQANVDLLQIKDSAAYPIAAETLLKLFKEGKVNACYAHSKDNCPICKKAAPSDFTNWDFETLDVKKDVVVLDSSTQLSASLLAFLMKGKPVTVKPERDDWGGLRKYTEFFNSQFQAAPYNLIVISHAQETDKTEDKRSRIVPTFGSAGASASFAKAFNDVIMTEIVNKKHRCFGTSTSTMNAVTKSRTDFKIEDMETPSLLPLFKS